MQVCLEIRFRVIELMTDSREGGKGAVLLPLPVWDNKM